MMPEVMLTSSQDAFEGHDDVFHRGQLTTNQVNLMKVNLKYVRKFCELHIHIN